MKYNFWNFKNRVNLKKRGINLENISLYFKSIFQSIVII